VVAELIVVPYLLGREGAGMGAGPLALERRAAEILRAERVARVDLAEPFVNEVGACFDLNRQVARAVAGTCERGALPVVLTGNCHTQQAVIAGLGADDLGLVWLDCHADFNTPETTESGFFDGCALAMTVGDCWAALCASVPGFAPLPAERVVLVGARDLEAAERARLDASAVVQLGPGEEGALAERLPATGRLSLHLDLDVLDPAYGQANRWAVPPGLSPDALLGAVRAVAGPRLAAVTLSAYDPELDRTGSVADAALAALRLLAR
jgi:arginase